MIELVNNKKHQIIKRDGRIENYDENKMRKVLDWAIGKALQEHFGNINETIKNNMIEEVLKDTEIKIFDRIHISKLFDAVIETCANKISELQPVWDKVARNLLIQKYYKEVWGIKRNEYPDYLEVIKKGIQYKVYNENIIASFTEKELKELGSYIKPERDFLFTFGGFDLFMKKYAKKYSKTKYLELPQHAMMRVAIQLHYKDKNRIEMIKKKYDMISKHQIAIPTPIYINALNKVYNPTSCVLIQVDDDSESILETIRDAGLYSRYGSGLGIDVSRLRCVGSSIKVEGESSGAIPFIKMFESTVSAFNQMSKRVGSAAIYFPWWHYEAPELVMLRDAGGKDDERARKLKYAIKWNRRFTKAIVNDEDIYLFDPKETPELLESYGEDFDKWYNFYSNKKGIKKRKIKARELAFLIAKVRSETGNLYWFSVDNANEHRMSRDFINQGNLCCAEVMLPTKPLKVLNTKLVKDFDTNEIKEIREVDGEIGICNLTSINLIVWDNLSNKEKDEFMYNLLVGFDNNIDYGMYPIKAGEKFNKLHRAIGVGTTNYQQWLASRGVKFTDERAKELTHIIYEDLYYYAVKNSIRLAKERGKYYYFEGSNWEKGIFHFETFKLPNELNFELKHNWEELRQEMMQYGVRFEFLMATPPGQTSSLVLNFTEGIEPIREFKIMKEGTYNLPFLAPNLHKYRKYYELAWDIPTKTILELTAIRQKFIDQGQSVNLYYKKTDSAFEIINDLIMAEKLQIKSLYYLNPMKAETEEICESCSV